MRREQGKIRRLKNAEFFASEVRGMCPVNTRVVIGTISSKGEE